MDEQLIRKTLSTMSKDMHNYLSCKDIDRFYMMINMTAGKTNETTSNVSSRGIKLKIHYNLPDEVYDVVRIDYINHNNGFVISSFDCLMADLKRYVGKAYKASSDHFFG